MENKINSLKEETEFFRSKLATEVPEEVTKNLFNSLKEQEEKGMDSVLKRLAFFHAIFALVSLLFCKQFGVGFFTLGLHTAFNFLGEIIASALSGAFFMGFSMVLTTLFFLNPIDRKEVKKDKAKHIASLAFISYLLLVMYGNFSILNSLAWLVAAISAGYYIFDQADQFLQNKKD